MAVECNICGWLGDGFLPRFRAHGRLCVCPGCRSLDRNRHLYHVIEQLHILHPDLAVLDVAPSVPIKRLLAPTTLYISIDLQGYTTDIIPMNLNRLEFPDEYFHFAMCSHVLEHMRDDIGGMRELFRVLAPGGVLLVQVPYYRTTETTELEEPDKHGHVRQYSPIDFVHRLCSVGFSVSRENHQRELPQLALDPLDVFVCTRQGGPLVRSYDHSMLKWFGALPFNEEDLGKDHSRKPIST